MNKSTWDSTVKPVVVLSVIALVVSFLLALVMRLLRTKKS